MTMIDLLPNKSDFWERRAPDYAADYHRSLLRQDVAAMIVRFAAVDAGRLLDLGCGSGQITAAILQQSPDREAVLVDRSAAMLLAATDLLRPYPSCRFVEASFENLEPIGSASIEQAFSSFALHHVTDVEKGRALAELRRVLTPGGRALIVDEIICDPAFHDERRLFRHMGDLFYPWLTDDELARKFDGFVEYPTSLPIFVELCEQAGFRVSVRALNGIVAAVQLEAPAGGESHAR